MKKITMLLLTVLGLAIGAVPASAQTVHRKKPAAVKKHKHVKKVHAGNAGLHATERLVLGSASALVIDQATGVVLFQKNPSAVLPIASITKLMTAMVVLDAKPNMEEVLSITEDDVDTLRGSHSRLRVGTRLPREDLLRLALMSSENRAASALSRNYPGGRVAFMAAMNSKALELGLTETHFDDPTGLTATNVSSARDLVKMVAAAHQYPLVREFTTTAEYQVAVVGHPQMFHNTNSLVRNSSWDIGLSKTGFINEAGKCLVMQAWFNKKPTIIVLLDSLGKMTRIGDANRIKRWVESAMLVPPANSDLPAQRQAAG